MSSKIIFPPSIFTSETSVFLHEDLYDNTPLDSPARTVIVDSEDEEDELELRFDGNDEPQEISSGVANTGPSRAVRTSAVERQRSIEAQKLAKLFEKVRDEFQFPFPERPRCQCINQVHYHGSDHIEFNPHLCPDYDLYQEHLRLHLELCRQAKPAYQLALDAAFAQAIHTL